MAQKKQAKINEPREQETEQDQEIKNTNKLKQRNERWMENPSPTPKRITIIKIQPVQQQPVQNCNNKKYKNTENQRRVESI